MKKILVLGYGSKAGAWKIRGEELGQAIGATVVNRLNNANLVGYDLVIVVKRSQIEDLQRIKDSGIPMVWDIVDAWPQPIGNWWAREVCVGWLKNEVKRMRPKAVVATTKVMEADCAKFNVPVLTLPHHARPDSPRTVIRDEIKNVGYEGGEHYLGRWDSILHEECKKRGWKFRREFSKNAPALTELDIAVAMREQNGYAAKNWKSNIKLANAQGTGTPCVMNREHAYVETASGAELWADDQEQLEAAFDELSSENGDRQRRSDLLYSRAPRLEQIAAQYKQWLEAL